MAPRWFERAEMELEDRYQKGEIDFGEYHNELRELRRDLDEAAREAANDEYERYRDEW